MKFFGVHIEDLESERFLSASNDQIATWLFLHALCSKQLNEGTIIEATSIPERFWSRHGIEKSILDQPSPLWSSDGESLVLDFYAIEGQALYEKKVAGGKAGGRGRKNRSPIRSPKGTPDRTPDRYNPTLPNITQPTKKRSASAFEKPTLEMVNQYGETLDPPFTNGNDFLDYYDSNGWKVGSSAMKDWKATVRRWNRNGKTATNSSKPKTRDLSANDCTI